MIRHDNNKRPVLWRTKQCPIRGFYLKLLIGAYISYWKYSKPCSHADNDIAPVPFYTVPLNFRSGAITYEVNGKTWMGVESPMTARRLKMFQLAQKVCIHPGALWICIMSVQTWEGKRREAEGNKSLWWVLGSVRRRKYACMLSCRELDEKAMTKCWTIPLKYNSGLFPLWSYVSSVNYDDTGLTKVNYIQFKKSYWRACFFPGQTFFVVMLSCSQMLIIAWWVQC